jgi:hypothetical protein
MLKRSTVVDAVADAPRTMAEMFAQQYPGLPDYDPLHETTVNDVSLADGCKRQKAESRLKDNGWIKRQVRLPNGHLAWAWRPKG